MATNFTGFDNVPEDSGKEVRVRSGDAGQDNGRPTGLSEELPSGNCTKRKYLRLFKEINV